MAVDPRTLQIGQTITVKELHFGIELNLAGAGEAGLTVASVGPEYLLLDDSISGSRTHIPLYLVQKSGQAPVRVESQEAA
jgi:hypothetical protein